MRTGQWIHGDELFNVTDSILLLLVSFKARHVFFLCCCTDVCLTRVSPGRKDIFLHFSEGVTANKRNATADMASDIFTLQSLCFRRKGSVFL